MRTVKKVSALVLTVMLLMSIMVLPASATTSDFYHFPLVTQSMGGSYMAAAVAAQKFLMVYDENFKQRISQSGGTDGFFGPTSAAVTRDFQQRESLVPVDGKVGSVTWTKFEELMNWTTISSIGLVYGMGVLDNSTRAKNWVIIGNAGYSAVTQNGVETGKFYYP